MTAWKIILGRKVIDTVFFDSDMNAIDVYTSLVNHDGYHPRIRIKRG